MGGIRKTSPLLPEGHRESRTSGYVYDVLDYTEIADSSAAGFADLLTGASSR